MKIDRRSFIGCIAGAGISCAVRGEAENTSSGNTYILLSDLHVEGNPSLRQHQNKQLEKIVDEILLSSPKPKGVICFGDIACSYGLEADYALAKRILSRLEDAHIEVHFALGNHDRRSTFFEKWPQCAKFSPVPGRCVSVVDLLFADFVILDALKGADDRALNDAGPGDGVIDDVQLKWFDSFVAKATRPFFVGSHQFIDLYAKGLSPIRRASKSRYFAGWIYGHEHRWEPSWRIADWKKRIMKPVLCLPSTGRWGDIGYVAFKVSSTGAVAELKMKDFYFPAPRIDGKRPAFWDARHGDLNGAMMHMPFDQDN